MRTGPGQLQPVWGPRHLRGAASADESWMDGGSIITNYQLPISSFGRRIFSGDVAAAVAGLVAGRREAERRGPGYLNLARGQWTHTTWLVLLHWILSSRYISHRYN